MKTSVLLFLLRYGGILALIQAIGLSGCSHFRHSKNPRIYGITVDQTLDLEGVLASVRALSPKPMVRLVLDPGVPAQAYRTAIDAIAAEAPVMAEPIDSYAMNLYGIESARARIREYLSAFEQQVTLWEIGNEINGEWLGEREQVAAKMRLTYDEVHARGKQTALTLYYNVSCWVKAENEMFRWVEDWVPQEMRQGLDYVWVSYYEDDCQGPRPDWSQVFMRLGELFRHAKLGFGEVGTKKAELKTQRINQYYRMQIAHPRYVGGYFWWYFRQDMVPRTQPLWSVLDQVIREDHAERR